LLKALDRKGFRSSRGVSSKSKGPRVFRASWRADMVSYRRGNAECYVN